MRFNVERADETMKMKKKKKFYPNQKDWSKIFAIK